MAAPNAAFAEAPPLSAYGNLPQFQDAALSPSGKRHAMIADREGVPTLFLVEGTRALSMMPVKDIKVRRISWLDEDTVQLITSNSDTLSADFTTARTEHWSAHLVSVDPKVAIRQVFSKQKGIFDAINGTFGVRTIDGRTVAYYSGIELKKIKVNSHMLEYAFDHNRPALFAVDIETMDAKRIAVAASEGEDRDWLVDANGGVAATSRIDGEGKWDIRNAAGTIIASGVNPMGRFSLRALGPQGRSVLYWAEDPAIRETVLFSAPLDGSAAASRFEPDVDIASLYIQPVTGHYTGYRTTDGDRIMLDPKIGQRIESVHGAFPALHSTVEDFSNDYATYLVRTDGNKDSGTWYKVDLRKGAADAIGYERLPVKPGDVGPISTFEYTASDGMELDGILTLPPGIEAKNLPVVMLPHGGPHSRDVEGFDWWAQAFASRGYAVFQPNFRGSTNRDEAFKRAGYGQWGRKMQTDVSDGLAALAKAGIVDGTRACIVGASYGGYAALAGVTVEQGKYRCAVAVAPVTDLKLLRRLDIGAVNETSGGMTGRRLEQTLGPRAELDAVSPLRLADRADAPIMLIHGRDDIVVEYLHSQKMAEALKNAGKPYEFVELSEEDHWLSKGPTRLQMLTSAVGFVQKHNPAR